MNRPEVLPRVWTPFGFAPYWNGGSDATISSNTTILNTIQVYRDLTINSGIVLTADNSPPVVICRTLKKKERDNSN